MKEFDKIYVAKYYHMLTPRQLAEDLNSTSKEIEDVLKELNSIGILQIYRDLSEHEWEKLERLKDEEIKIRFYKKSKIIQKKQFQIYLRDLK